MSPDDLSISLLLLDMIYWALSFQHIIICILILCMRVLPVYIYGYHMCAWYLKRSEEDVRSSTTRVMDVCGYFKLKPGTLQEQRVL